METIDHALVTCSEVHKIWELVGKWWKKKIEEVTTIHGILQEENISVRDNSVWTAVKWSFLYLIWIHRNTLVFSGVKSNLLDNFLVSQRNVFEWISRRANKWSKGWEEWIADPSTFCG